MAYDKNNYPVLPGALSTRNPREKRQRAQHLLTQACDQGSPSEARAAAVGELVDLGRQGFCEACARAIYARLGPTLGGRPSIHVLEVLEQLMRNVPFFFKYTAYEAFFQRLWRIVVPPLLSRASINLSRSLSLAHGDVGSEAARKVLILLRAWARELNRMYGQTDPAAKFWIRRFQMCQQLLRFPSVPATDVPWVYPTDQLHDRPQRYGDGGGGSEATVALSKLVEDLARKLRQLRFIEERRANRSLQALVAGGQEVLNSDVPGSVRFGSEADMAEYQALLRRLKLLLRLCDAVVDTGDVDQAVAHIQPEDGESDSTDTSDPDGPELPAKTPRNNAGPCLQAAGHVDEDFVMTDEEHTAMLQRTARQARPPRQTAGTAPSVQAGPSAFVIEI